jgi:hypothetical protein
LQGTLEFFPEVIHGRRDDRYTVRLLQLQVQGVGEILQGDLRCVFQVLLETTHLFSELLAAIPLQDADFCFPV